MSLIIHINYPSIFNETNSQPSNSFNQIKSFMMPRLWLWPAHNYNRDPEKNPYLVNILIPYQSLNIYIESLSLLCQINPYIIITISTILKIYVVFSFIHSLNYVYLIQITTQSSNDTNQRTIIDLILTIRFNSFLLIGKQLISIIS